MFFDLLLVSVQQEPLAVFDDDTVIPAEQLITTLLIMFLSLGVGIGVIGSAISIRRFLDV